MSQYICERIGAILDVTLFLILTSAFVSVIIVIIFIILMVKRHKKVKTIKERQEKELKNLESIAKISNLKFKKTINIFQINILTISGFAASFLIFKTFYPYYTEESV